MPQSNGNNPTGALVVGGDYQGLGIARSLGRHGVPVCILDDERSIARFSRYSAHAVKVPDLRSEQTAVETVLKSTVQGMAHSAYFGSLWCSASSFRACS